MIWRRCRFRTRAGSAARGANPNLDLRATDSTFSDESPLRATDSVHSVTRAHYVVATLCDAESHYPRMTP